ncbi:uncharacterized protein LOC132919483 [Rhopalosiphum padi]|uniref:uncharacterized protein LOC132919483 n=1 Tax=Rhopalosiphum padi TaxID=40932 RepID=UPI00298D7D20|nr:uncharacterized protein LOC132919483 [Rhopalosiphum padi]
MPKIPSSKLKNLIAQWILPLNKNNVIFTTDGATLFCQLCNKHIPCIKKSQITQHVHTSLHQEALNRKLNTSKQLFLSESTSKKNVNEFYEDLCLSFISANIPWYKLQNPQFRAFLEKYIGKHIPDESLLRKNYLPHCYDKTLSNIKNEIGENNIWIAVDETTDINGRYVANLLVGILKSNHPTRSFLLTCKVLEKTNHSTVARFVNDGLKLLWPLGGNDEKVLLMLSDAAPYMVKTGQSLKVFYPNLIHVTCAAHMLNRVAEKVREMYPDVNSLINNIKKVFLKAPYHVQVYKELLPDIPLPPEPVLTRWGTWLEAAVFNCDHFQGLKKVIEELSKQKSPSQSILKCKSVLELKTVENELIFIKTHFLMLITAIKNLEKSNVTLVDSINLIESTIVKLQQIPGENGEKIKIKIEQLQQKNQGLTILKNVAKMLKGNNEIQFVDNFSPTMVTDLQYAPVTSVDVERSFSTYKNILTDRRTKMTPEHMEQNIVVNCFQKGELS